MLELLREYQYLPKLEYILICLYWFDTSVLFVLFVGTEFCSALVVLSLCVCGTLFCSVCC
jgi:hypothetical protein